MHFRPGDLPAGDPTQDEGPVEWADNSLSNTLAYVSHRFLPRWCQTPSHWTAKLTAYLFTDCPCCLLFRGLVIGAVVTLMLLSVVLLLTVMVVAWKR